MKKTQILFDFQEQQLFDYVANRSKHLRFITELSEIWLLPQNKFKLGDEKYKSLMYTVKDRIKEIINLLYKSVEVNQDKT